MRVGYRRCSSVEQKFDRQDLGEVDKLFEEKVSGASADRTALNEMLSFVIDLAYIDSGKFCNNFFLFKL